jgi:hypothetical protein
VDEGERGRMELLGFDGKRSIEKMSGLGRLGRVDEWEDE